MSFAVSSLLVAVTAVIWLLFVTLAPEANTWSALLQQCAYFLTAMSVARIAELTRDGLVADADGNSHTTDLVKVTSSIMIYVAATLVWLHFGLGFDVQNLLATSAVVTLVLGFALQSTLGNVFSGLALELERTVRVGDFVRQGNTVGEVEALKWRSVLLRTSDGALVIMPNSTLGTHSVEVVRRGAMLRCMVKFHVPGDIPPMIVLEAVRGVLALDAPGVAREPAGSAVILDIEVKTGSILYGARFYSLRPMDLTSQASVVLTRIWYVLNRQGVPMTALLESHAASRMAELPMDLVAEGRLVRFGPGEELPKDLAGFVVDGFLLEEVLDHEIDLSAQLALLLQADYATRHPLRLLPTVLREIAEQSALALGPIAFTLAEHFAGLTDDPYFVYYALATRIPDDADKARFLAHAPARPLRRLGGGSPVGWAGLTGLEAPAARRRTIPVHADLIVFERSLLADIMLRPAGQQLVQSLRRAPQFAALSDEEIGAFFLE
jgi:small-conductance mechanosensitive channel